MAQPIDQWNLTGLPFHNIYDMCNVFPDDFERNQALRYRLGVADKFLRDLEEAGIGGARVERRSLWGAAAYHICYAAELVRHYRYIPKSYLTSYFSGFLTAQVSR